MRVRRDVGRSGGRDLCGLLCEGNGLLLCDCRNGSDNSVLLLSLLREDLLEESGSGAVGGGCYCCC